MINAVIFPSSFFNTHKVDEDLEKEYDAAVSTGLFENILLFSYEDWFHNGKLVLTQIPDQMICAVYRGWMMKPEQYELFYNRLLTNNISLITPPDAYALFHIFPNIYPYIRSDTPKTLIVPEDVPLDLELVKKEFPRFLVKDYVKSVKGTEFPAFFDRSVSAEDFNHWIEVFRKYRGSLLTGGFCIKEYVELKEYAGIKNEYRVFYINNEVASISRNSGQPCFTTSPPEELVQKYRILNSPFYTVDYAELADGSWVILEAGDGSVSGLSDFQDYNSFFRTLFHCFM